MSGLILSHRVRACAVTLLLISFSLTVGCSSSNYVTPGPGANLHKFIEADADLQTIYERKPAAQFPARLAVIRIQGSGYRSYSGESYGRGSYSVITVRDVETDEQFNRIAKMPLVAGVAPVNRLVLSSNINSVKDLRTAAAQLQADMLLLYSFDTVITIDDHDLGPLNTITLGIFPFRKPKITTTVSAVIYDVRSEFLYGLCEATEKASSFTNSWSTESAIEESRLKTESLAMDKLVGELEKTWVTIVATHAPGRTTAP